MPDIWYIDAETRSACELPTRKRKKLAPAGNYNYMVHPTTDANCLALAHNDEKPVLWLPGNREYGDIVQELIVRGVEVYVGSDKPGSFCLDVVLGQDFTKQERSEVWAHNAVFERLLFQHVMGRHGFPSLTIEQMVCTQVLCANMALPMSLENAAAALQLEERKDMEKRKDMLFFSKPRSYNPVTGEPIFPRPIDFPERFVNMCLYCIGDVVVERLIAKQVKALTPFQRRVYVIDQRINDRGMLIDLPAVKVMKRLAEKEQDRLNRELKPLCGTTFSQVEKIGDWIKSKGIPVPSLTKHDLSDLLAVPNLPADVRRVLEIRREAAKSSVAKLDAMLRGVCADGRVRGCFQMGGAVSTFRWSGRIVQTQNMPRPELSAEVIETILDWLGQQRLDTTADEDYVLDVIRAIWGHPMSVFSDCLRGLIVAKPGHILLGPDLVSIESFMSAWLVGDDTKVQFMANGGQQYEKIARLIHNLPPDAPVPKPMRQKGKVAELALGYQGGKGAISKMALLNGLQYPGDAEAERWRDVWREAHPHHVAYWAQINDRAIEAVLNPGTKYSLGPEGRRVTFVVRGRWLFCLCPSQSVLCYPYPKIGTGKFGGDAVTYMKAKDKRWFRNHYYGGHGLENVTQHEAMMLAAEGLLNLEEEDFPVVQHAHDEGVPEVPDPGNDKARDDLMHAAMRAFSRPPEWAKTLPYTSSAFWARRYRK